MTRQTAFPEYDNGAEFDLTLSRLAPYGFADSSHANDLSPSLCREMARGVVPL